MLAIAFMLIAVGTAAAAEHDASALPISPADVLRYINAQGWKWKYHSQKPFKDITLRLVHHTRNELVWKREIIEEWSHGGATHDSEDILIVCGDKDKHPNFLLQIGDAHISKLASDIVLNGNYRFLGKADGAAPALVGSEYILIAACKDGGFYDKKGDLLWYVGLEIETD
jgi:hypothetical protein